MEQLKLFEFSQFTFVYESCAGHAKKWRMQSVIVHDGGGIPIIHICAETYGNHPTKARMIDLARTAVRQADTRPYGDEYGHMDGAVSYLYEK